MDAAEMEALSRHWSSVTQQASNACAKASHPIVSDPDKGRHLSPEDIQEAELIAAGFSSAAMHPRSFVFIRDGIRYTRPMAYALMLKERGEANESTE
jgi:hypothetical protein